MTTPTDAWEKGYIAHHEEHCLNAEAEASALRTSLTRAEAALSRFERVTDYILDSNLKRLDRDVLRNLASTARAALPAQPKEGE